MTPELLRKATGCTQARAELYAGPLTAACAMYGIDTPTRLAAFLAQIGHESGSFRYTSELWGPTPQQARYEGRLDLGNNQPGDGAKFKGHGLIQTTGRHNHARVRDRLRARFDNVPDFEVTPEALIEPQWACLSATDYWDDKGLNALADAGEFDRITKKINGAQNGRDDRLKKWDLAKRVLNEEQPTTQEAAMAFPLAIPILSAILPMFAKSIPMLAEIFPPGTEVAKRNVKAAELAVNVITEAVGASNAQEALGIIQSDPAAAAVASAAVQKSWYEISLNIEGVTASREANVASTGRFWLQPAIWVTAMLMPLIYGVTYQVMTGDFSSEVQSMVIASVITGCLGAVSGFWLGTSFSSSRKTELMSK